MATRWNPLPWKFDRIGSVSSGGGITQVTTEDGVVVPAAGNINIYADDTTENDVNGLKTDGQTANTVFVLLTNRLQNTATVVGADTEDLITFDLGASPAVYRFQFHVTGRETTTGDGLGYDLFGSAKTDGAAVTKIKEVFQDADEDTDLEDAKLALVASGNNIILQVTGVEDTTISYSAVGTYVMV